LKNFIHAALGFERNLPAARTTCGRQLFRWVGGRDVAAGGYWQANQHSQLRRARLGLWDPLVIGATPIAGMTKSALRA